MEEPGGLQFVGLPRVRHDRVTSLSLRDLLLAQRVKSSASNVGDLSSIPGSGRSPEEENGNPPQCSCLENPMEGGAWRATIRKVTKSQT